MFICEYMHLESKWESYLIINKYENIGYGDNQCTNHVRELQAVDMIY